MKPETTEDILELMNGSIVSSALCAAMELGVFWFLAQKPLSATEVAQTLNIPLNRCQHWLQILCKLGLLDNNAEEYALSIVAREAILKAQSQDTWAFQAREDRESSVFVRDLALNIGQPISAWQTWNVTPPDYFQHIQQDPSYAARFTRKLYEIHCPLAEQLANLLDLTDIRSLLDLGGGSGVVSFALLRKQHDLTSVVVDVENVCQAGRVIAAENGLEKRITYWPADLDHAALPTGFDMVMICDVGSFGEIILRRIYDVLNPEGHLVIVDKFAPSREQCAAVTTVIGVSAFAGRAGTNHRLDHHGGGSSSIAASGFSRLGRNLGAAQRSSALESRLGYAESSKADENGLTQSGFAVLHNTAGNACR